MPQVSVGEQLKGAVRVLDEGGTALHPIAGIAVEYVADRPHLRLVDMAADHPVHFAANRFVGEGRFESR